jgi:hypothetical protein
MGESTILPACSWTRVWTLAGGDVRLGLGIKNPHRIDRFRDASETQSDGRRNETAGVARYKRRHRRKLCCGDYNPAHVESGRLQGFPVEGAFASGKTRWPARYSELRDSTAAAWFCASQACSNSAGGR